MLKNNMNPNDINYINSQLKNINLVLNNVNDDIKKMKNQLEQIKINNNNILKKNNFNEKNKLNESKNQIICVYKKDKDEINLLHDYKINLNDFMDEQKREWYIEAKNEINEKNIDIYINDKKIKFDYRYKSNERGDIKVKFIFHNLLTNIYCMFRDCSSLKSIDLSSFNTTNVNDMESMFRKCKSLKSLDLSSFDTTNVSNMILMFSYCSSLKKENIKISKNGLKIMDEIKKYL
jgi:surface protein